MGTRSLEEVLLEYREKSDSELFVALGQAQVRNQNPSHFQFSDSNDEAAGRNWFVSNFDRIKKTVCAEGRYRRFYSDQGTTTDLGLLTSLAGLLSEFLSPVTASLVALLILRRGLEKICDGAEDQQGG